jgi:diguanylate cyclase (GGDEF)-like protein
MLSEQEIQQIGRKYEITCPVCGTENAYYRLKRDICRPAQTEGDGHPLSYKWGKPGFDSVDPKQFFFGVCSKCRFTGELDDADYRQSAKFSDEYRALFLPDSLRTLLMANASGKGLGLSLGKRIRDDDPMGSIIAQFHLGVYCESLRVKVIHNNIARYYLRLAWVFRSKETFYPATDVETIAGKFARIEKRWKREVPKQSEFPVVPGMALNELDALRFSRSFFERNYEMLRETQLEGELRLRHLLGEIGFRIYELSPTEEDFRKASSFFSGAMQQCMSIISDKSVVGGIVNRAKEMLEICGERGRVLRELHKKHGGAEGEPENGGTVAKRKKKVKKAKASKAAGRPKTNGKKEGATTPKAPDKEEQRDLDQARRQVGVLQEEVAGLKEQVAGLEEDNKKWRQLAGRDAVTGLPNKTMLFRLVIPKVLKNIGTVGPFSCIGISFDQVGQVNQGHGWLVGDRMLKDSAKSLRHFVQEGEELYRLEGVHFALVGAMSNNAARQRATEMRRRLAKASVQIDDTQCPLVASLGVVTVEKIVGKSPAEVANGIFEAVLGTLYRAKDKGGNAVEVHSATKF